MPLRSSLLVLCLVITAPTQEPAFEAVTVKWPDAVTRIELGALVFELVDGALVIAGEQGRRALPATSPTGEVHAIAKHRNRQLFAACQHGLFVCDAQYPVLDRADQRDGVVPGPLLGICADHVGRLWLCSDRQFGCFDPRFGFGRVFSEADGPPATPYRGLALGGEQGLLLRASAGVFAYEPDRGSPPGLIAGLPAEGELRATPTGTLQLDLRGSGRGGVTWRQRRQHHHLLAAMPDGRIEGLRPGRHAVEIFAVDRDLRRRRIAVQSVFVPLPARFDTRWLPPVAAGCLVLLFGVVFLAARGGRGRWHRAWRAAVATSLLAVLGLQLLAACLGYGRSWPFVGFSMYTETWQQDDVLHRPQIRAVRADGTVRAFGDKEAGILQDGSWQMLAEIVHGDQARRQRFLEQLNRRRRADEDPFVGFDVVDGRIRLTPDGPVDVAPVFMASLRSKS